MCTVVFVNGKEKLFGRNLDVFSFYGEKIVITPKNYVFEFSDGFRVNNHYSIIGVAVVKNNVPLYFDAANSRGLCVAGLNFPEECLYNEERKDKTNVASYEFISRILSVCKNTEEAEKEILKMNITKRAFDEGLPPTPLHWIVSDENASLTVEQTERGLSVYNNKFGVLTNSPEFPFQMDNINCFMPFSNQKGTSGIPGDYTSQSRFVRACFVKEHSLFEGCEEENICQFFRMLYSVQHNLGCVLSNEGYEYTSYSSCINTKKGIYYYTTYNNLSINAVDMKKEDTEGINLIEFDMKTTGKIKFQN